MKKFFSVAGGIASAALLAGCSATGGNGGGNPPIPPQSPLHNYSAVTLNAAGVTKSEGTIHHNGSQMSIEVGGNTYTAGNGTHGGLLGNTSLDQYAFNDGTTSGMAIQGQHALAGALLDSANDQAYFAVNGTETITLPTQTADYVGFYALTDGIDGAQGNFDAAVDFNAGTIDFTIYDMTSPIGTGTCALQATGFTSTFNTTGAFASTNNVDGQFYGPNAEELAGLIQGTSGGNPTAGFLIGKQ